MPPSPSTTLDKATRTTSPKEGENPTLEHVLAAAKRRRAPVSVETAGYIALGIADSMVTTPGIVDARHVHITTDGAVKVQGAIHRGDEHEAEKSIRTLLSRLLSVTVGTSPALVAVAQRSHSQGLDALVTELETALVPVNRAAARRTIGRLTREVQRAGIQLPAKQKVQERENLSQPQPPAQQQLRSSEKTSPPKPLPEPVVTEEVPAFQGTEEALPQVEAQQVEAQQVEAQQVEAQQVEAQQVDLTEVDAPVAPVASASGSERNEIENAPKPRNTSQPSVENSVDQPDDTAFEMSLEPSIPVEAFAWEKAESNHATRSDFPPVVETSSPSLTPQLATYDPTNAEIVETSPFVKETSVVDLDDDLLTYEPPEASGDDSLDFGTASPPQVIQFPEETIEGTTDDSIDTTEASPLEMTRDESDGAECEASVEDKDDGVVQDFEATASSDRVKELLAGFGPPERPTQNVAGELKSMLGLAPTPLPPLGQPKTLEGKEEEKSSTDPEDSQKPRGPRPLEFTPPRNPKRSIYLSAALLLLALGVLFALYVRYPALLLGH